MKKERTGISIRVKMYIFVMLTVLSVAFGTSAIAYTTGADQIDRYYKQNTADNARNFASMVDGDFLKELRVVAASEEFQALREQAEAADDEALIEDCLRDPGQNHRIPGKHGRDQVSLYYRTRRQECAVRHVPG